MKFRYQKIPFQGHDSRRPLIPRPYIPIYLLGKAKSTPSPYYALLDSGADKVLMPAELAAEVGIENITKGILEPAVGIANQRTDVYYHDGLALKLLGDTKAYPTPVGFSGEIVTPILGRSFFTHFKAVIFSEGKEEIELV